jgi:hypothetical protein
VCHFSRYIYVCFVVLMFLVAFLALGPCQAQSVTSAGTHLFFKRNSRIAYILVFFPSKLFAINAIVLIAYRLSRAKLSFSSWSPGALSVLSDSRCTVKVIVYICDPSCCLRTSRLCYALFVACCSVLKSPAGFYFMCFLYTLTTVLLAYSDHCASCIL